MVIDFQRATPAPGNLDVTWIHGTRDRTDPPVQTHHYDEHTVIVRQSKDVHFEAPFVFLLFGNDRAMLLDTGAVDDHTLRAVVDGLITNWLAAHPRDAYHLVVAHTHGHGDHVAGDPSFADRPDTTIVGGDVDAVRAFFGVTDWPQQVVPFDLGGRVVDVMGIPGHHNASIAVYDAWTGILFTGDTVLPARLYVQDMPAFLDSLDRLVGYAEAHPVTHVLGCHIEMTRAPGRDFFPGCRYQPHEPPLQLTVDQLREVRDSARSVAHRPGVHRFDDFIIYNGMGLAAGLRLNARGLAGKLRAIVTR